MCGWVVQQDGLCVRTKHVDVLRVYADADEGCGRDDAWVDVLHVYADADGGHGHVDAQADMLRVYADADGGRGHVDAWMRCVCVRTWMSIKKSQKKSNRKKQKGKLTLWMRMMNMGIGTRMHFVQTCWHVDVDDCKEKQK